MRKPNILEYLPEVFRQIKELISLANTDNPELETIWREIEYVYNDQFLYLMGETGTERWEKMLKISPLGTDTLEDRRFRVINRLNAQLPYTFNMLKAHLSQMCGKDGYELSYNPETWTLSVKVALSAKKQFDEICDMTKEMIPANILLYYTLLYNMYGMLKDYTHGYLSGYRHKDIRDEILESKIDTKKNTLRMKSYVM